MERLQGHLGHPERLKDHTRSDIRLEAKIEAVDYVNGRVEVVGAFGKAWARVIFRKSSTLAGKDDMPNEGEIGIVSSINHDWKNLTWEGSVMSSNQDARLPFDENYPGSVDGLVHRSYSKHETSSFTILDKLGNLLAKWRKKASQETDPAQPNLDVSLNAGVLTITHYRGASNNMSSQYALDQAGNLTLTLFQDDGATVALQLASDKNGNVSLTGKAMVAINGGQALAFNSALMQLKSQLDDVVAKVNAMTYPVEITTGPGAGSTGIAGPTNSPITETPLTTPTGTSKTTAG